MLVVADCLNIFSLLMGFWKILLCFTGNVCWPYLRGRIFLCITRVSASFWICQHFSSPWLATCVRVKFKAIFPSSVRGQSYPETFRFLMDRVSQKSPQSPKSVIASHNSWAGSGSSRLCRVRLNVNVQFKVSVHGIRWTSGDSKETLKVLSGNSEDGRHIWWWQ